jgi:hypothetical protein
VPTIRLRAQMPWRLHRCGPSRGEVTAACLRRVRFSYADSPQDARVHLVNPQAAWEKATIEDRKRLLALAIDRVVLIPWPDEDARRRAWKGRKVRIERADRLDDQDVPAPLDLMVPSTSPRSVRRPISEGRVTSFRLQEAEEAERRKETRRQRTSAYYREWAAVRAKFGPT